MSDPDNYVPAQPDEAHFQISQKAAESLGRLVDGNGLKADQVRLARHETLVHQVPGYVHVELKPDIVTGQRKGNVPIGKVLGGKEAVHSEAAGLVRDFSHDKNIQQQILMDVRKDEGKGFGMPHFKIALPATMKEFSVVEQCLKCGGSQYYTCVRCHATGMIPCQQCNGMGAQQCPQCYGSGQYRRGGGEMTPCNRCSTQGRITCLGCQGQRQLRCTACNGQGKVGCTECDRSGFWTNVFQLSFHAEGQFILDREQLPPDVLAIIDHIGERNIATRGYAEIFRAGVNAQDKMIVFPLIAFLPIAQAEFTIEGKPYPATVAGLPGRIMTIEPVLDTAIKPGINALFKLSKGPMAAEALIERACRFRIIRQVLAGLTIKSKKQVYLDITREYPVGLSQKYAQAVIRYAADAILAIGRGPRLKGLIAGTVLSAGAAAAYYMTPVRLQALQMMTQQGHARHMLAVDLLDWAVCYLVAWLTIKIVAKGALKKLLPGGAQGQGKGLPSAGEHGMYAVGTTLVAWLAVAFTAPVKPDWVTAILKLTGHG